MAAVVVAAVGDVVVVAIGRVLQAPDATWVGMMKAATEMGVEQKVNGEGNCEECTHDG